MRVLSLVLTMLVLFSGGVFSQDITDLPPRNFDIESYFPASEPDLYFRSTNIDSMIEWVMTTNHMPGVAAALVTDEGLTWAKGYGMANFATETPVETSTLFMLASISKVVTGTALMQLYEDGLFALEDNINDYLPFDVINPWHPDSVITFYMLMTHTSSIKDNFDVMIPWSGDSPVPLGAYLEQYLTPGGSYYDPALNYSSLPPGTNWDYASNGFALVGYLVEVISGMDFEDYCQQEIFVPLDMNETSWRFVNLDPDHIAMPYGWNGNYVPYGYWGYSDYPSSTLRTSVLQLANFLFAYMNGGVYGEFTLLETSTIDMMLTLQIPELAEFMGLAWWYQSDEWGHNGNDGGVATRMSFDPVEELGVIVLSNSGNIYDVLWITDRIYEFSGDWDASVDPWDSDSRSNGRFDIGAAYPNPFSTAIHLTTNFHTAGNVKVAVYDLDGRLVKTLFAGHRDKGWQSVVWDGRNRLGQEVASGWYSLQVQTKGVTDGRRVLFVR